LTSVDSFTGKLEIVPIFGLPDQNEYHDDRSGTGVNSKQVFSALLTLFASNGFPSQILFDRGSYFLRLQTLLKERYGINCIALPPNSAWRRGRVERPHKELNRIIRSCVLNKKYTFQESLTLKVLELNNSPNSIGISPNQLFYTFFPSPPLLQNSETTLDEEDVELPSADHVLFDKSRFLMEILEPHRYLWSEKRFYNRNKMLKTYSETKNLKPVLKPSDSVIVFKSTSGKYEPCFRGPLTITRIHENGDYELSDGTVQSIENLKLFHEEDPVTKTMENSIVPKNSKKFATVQELKNCCHSTQVSRPAEYVWFKTCSTNVSEYFKNSKILFGAIVNFKLINDKFVSRSVLTDFKPENGDQFLLWIPSNGEFLWSKITEVFNFSMSYSTFVNVAKSDPNVWLNVQIGLESYPDHADYEKDHPIHLNLFTELDFKNNICCDCSKVFVTTSSLSVY